MIGDLGAALLEQVLRGERASRLSVVGLSKNAGKTVTLNHLIQAAAERSMVIGLVSTGRDGEEQDAITELPKPRIWAPRGAWIATAEKAVPMAHAELTPFRLLPIVTPFGAIQIARVERAGEVLLIGPGSARRLSGVLGGLEAHGAQVCLVDGSFDRIAAAAPGVTDRVVLAAGAAYSANQAETLAQIRHLLDIFDLPTVHPALETAVDQSARRGPVGLVTLSGAVHDLPVTTALGDPEPIVSAALERQEYGPYVVVGGALGDRLVMSLLKARASRVGLIVPDPTHIMVERNLWRRWRRQGGEVLARRAIRVVAVTTNAHSPVGQDYDAREFHDAVQEIANRPVYDLQAGLVGGMGSGRVNAQ